MSCVLDGLHADDEGGGDVFGFVVNEEDVGGRGVETFGCVEVDGGIRFGGSECVGPGAVVKVGEPGVFLGESGGHAVADVGEDTCGDARALEALGPVEHGSVDQGPEIGVCFDEIGELAWGEDDCSARGDGVPV